MGHPESFATLSATPLAPGPALPLARYRFTFRMADELRLPEFAEFMKALQSMSSGEYLRYTAEALELLKWIRQFVDAVEMGT